MRGKLPDNVTCIVRAASLAGILLWLVGSCRLQVGVRERVFSVQCNRVFFLLLSPTPSPPATAPWICQFVSRAA